MARQNDYYNVLYDRRRHARTIYGIYQRVSNLTMPLAMVLIIKRGSKSKRPAALTLPIKPRPTATGGLWL